MPLSRRQVLVALGLGITTGGLQEQFERALDTLTVDDELLLVFDDSLRGFQKAARTLPAPLLDGLTGHVAVLDGLRRRTGGPGSPHQHRCATLQARYAELLSWRGGCSGAGIPSRLDGHHVAVYGHDHPGQLARAYANAGQPVDACRVA